MSDTPKTIAEEQIVVFQIGREMYGIDISKVQEIIVVGDIVEVPLSPISVKGVINLRGKVIPVIDLRYRLGLSPGETHQASRIVIVNVNGDTIGIMADEVFDVMQLSPELVESTPHVIAGAETNYFYGIAKLSNRLISLIDLEKLLNVEE